MSNNSGWYPGNPVTNKLRNWVFNEVSGAFQWLYQGVVKATLSAAGVLTAEGFTINLGSVLGLYLPGSTYSFRLVRSGTQLHLKVNDVTIYTFNPTASGEAGMSIGGIRHDYYGFVSDTTIPRWKHVGRLTFYGLKAMTGLTDWIHHVFSITGANGGTTDGEMAFAIDVSTGTKFGITAWGARAEWRQNKSGGALTCGMPVVPSGDAYGVTTNSNAADPNLEGVVWTSSIPNDDWGWVIVGGECKLAYTGTAPTAGDSLECSATPGAAQKTATPTAGATLGVALTNGSGGFCRASYQRR